MKHSKKCGVWVHPSIVHLEIYNYKVYVLRKALGNLRLNLDMCCSVGHPNKTFGLLFYKAPKKKFSIAQRVVFQERELTSKRVSGIHTDIDKIHELTNEEPKVGPRIKFKIDKVVKETNIPLTLHNRLDTGHYIPSHVD